MQPAIKIFQKDVITCVKCASGMRKCIMFVFITIKTPKTITYIELHKFPQVYVKNEMKRAINIVEKVVITCIKCDSGVRICVMCR